MFINPASLGSGCSMAEINDEASETTSAYEALHDVRNPLSQWIVVIRPPAMVLRLFRHALQCINNRLNTLPELVR